MQRDREILTVYTYVYERMNGVRPIIPASHSNLLPKFMEEYKVPYFSSVYNYILYQFSYWMRLSLNKFGTKIPLNCIIGAKALKRYRETDTRAISFAVAEIKERYKLKLSDVYVIVSDVDPHALVEDEEALKKIYHCTEEGLVLCIDYTTLFKEKSIWCSSCSNKNRCIEILNSTYPYFAKERGVYAIEA